MFIGKKVVYKGKTYDNYFATEEGFVYSLQEKGGWNEGQKCLFFMPINIFVLIWTYVTLDYI